MGHNRKFTTSRPTTLSSSAFTFGAAPALIHFLTLIGWKTIKGLAMGERSRDTR